MSCDRIESRAGHGFRAGAADDVRRKAWIDKQNFFTGFGVGGDYFVFDCRGGIELLTIGLLGLEDAARGIAEIMDSAQTFQEASEGGR